jgi:hypothetical protein
MPPNFAHLGGLNAYEILGIEPTATAEEIEAAYRSAIKRQHSDTGGVTRLAQLVNDARDALVKDRASYDVWLRNQSRPRVTDAKPDPAQRTSASESSRSSWADAGNRSEKAWDPWETSNPWDASDPWEATSRRTPPQTPPEPEPQHPPDGTTADPEPTRRPLSAEERRSALLAVVASVFLGPLGLWLGIRSYKRSRSVAAIVAIVIGGMSVLYLVSLAMAIALGLFREPVTTSSVANPSVLKQDEVVVRPGTKVALDEEGTSYTPSTDDASLASTESGLLMKHGTTYVALEPGAPETYDTCSGLNYPEPTGKQIPWNRLTVGSMLCVRTSYLETTTSLITVVDRSGRSVTLQIVTWND